MSNLSINYPLVQRIGDGISIPDKFIFRFCPNTSPVEINKFQYREFRKEKKIKGLIDKGKLLIQLPERPSDFSDTGVPSDLIELKQREILTTKELNSHKHNSISEMVPSKEQTIQSSLEQKPEAKHGRPYDKASESIDSKDPQPKITKTNKKANKSIALKQPSKDKSHKIRPSSNLDLGLLIRIAKELSAGEQTLLEALITKGEKISTGEVFVSLAILQELGLPHNRVSAARKGLKEKGYIDFDFRVEQERNPSKRKMYYYTIKLNNPQ